jgi:hypothetical protein
MSNPIDCRFITSPYKKNEHGEEYGEAIYLRQEDVVRLIREAIDDASETADNANALADALERIER